MAWVFVTLLTSTVKRQQVLGQWSRLKDTVKDRVAPLVWMIREHMWKLLALAANRK